MNVKNVIALLVMLFVFMSFVFTGCGPGPGPGPDPGPPPPAICSEVYVQSNNQWVFGTVVVNGISHGEILLPWSAVLVNRPQIRCGDIVSVFIQRPDGAVSRTINATAVPPRTIVTFDAM